MLAALTAAAVLNHVRFTDHQGNQEDFDAEDGWINGWVLCHPALGGSEGLRRLRQLRAEGHNIEKRPSHGSTNVYRIVLPLENIGFRGKHRREQFTLSGRVQGTAISPRARYVDGKRVEATPSGVRPNLLNEVLAALDTAAAMFYNNPDFN